MVSVGIKWHVRRILRRSRTEPHDILYVVDVVRINWVDWVSFRLDRSAENTSYQQLVCKLGVEIDSMLGGSGEAVYEAYHIA